MLASINAGHGCRQRTQQTRCSERPYTLRLPTDTKSPCLLKETKAVILCGTTLIAGQKADRSFTYLLIWDKVTVIGRSGLLNNVVRPESSGVIFTGSSGCLAPAGNSLNLHNSCYFSPSTRCHCDLLCTLALWRGFVNSKISLIFNTFFINENR